MIVVVVLLVAIASFLVGCAFTASRARLSRRGGYVDLSVGAARGMYGGERAVLDVQDPWLALETPSGPLQRETRLRPEELVKAGWHPSDPDRMSV